MGKLRKKFGNVAAILGAQWGDEGKGKLIDIFAGEYDVVVRGTGGANAGHTIYPEKGKKVVFHLVPSGIFHPKNVAVLGNGMVIHFPTLFEEMEVLKKFHVKTKGRILISGNAHIVFEYHKKIDQILEEMKGGAKVGTTGRGIGPAYTDKIMRIGIRVSELENFKKFEEHFLTNLKLFQKMYGFHYDPSHELAWFKRHHNEIGEMLCDTNMFLGEVLEKKKSILLEGANGTHLDIDHGTYPYVTSSNATIGGLVTGTGIAPKHFKSIIGIVKAYVTRVGNGPFLTELTDSLGDQIREQGSEYGSTTGRPRRCGWFDAVIIRQSIRLNGLTSINLTKLDVLTNIPKLKICVSYKKKNTHAFYMPPTLDGYTPEYIEMPGWVEDISKARKFSDLPKNCQKYVQKIAELIKVPIHFIGVGQTRQEMIISG